MSTDLPTDSTIDRETAPGMQIVSLKSSSVSELFITADLCEKDVAQVARDAMEIVNAKGATVVSQVVFAPMGSDNETVNAMKQALGDCDWPLTWVDSGHKRGSSLGGMHIHAVSGTDVQRLSLNGRTVGSVYQDESTKFCCLGDLWTSESDDSRTEQAEQTFDMMEEAIKLAGMDFSNIVRTWLYLDELLQWYDPFNRVRDEFFKRRGVFDALVPSSTGISGANPAGAAMIAAAMGIQPLDGAKQAEMLPSPLQCPALEYGSSFSRAVAIDQPGRTRITVSGTASIEPGGKTVYIDDVPGQIDLTMRVVAAILDQRNAGWSDVTRSIAYFKRADYLAHYVKYCQDNDIPDMPIILTENDVCRGDLLFEIELDTLTTIS